jgi:hypothetical protein
MVMVEGKNMMKRISRRYRSFNRNGERYTHIGIEADGTLYNPHNYPEEKVREVVLWADDTRRQQRADAIKRGVETRRKRRENKIIEIAKTLLAGNGIGNQDWCACCKKILNDPESIDRGIGPECWQQVLAAIEREKESVARHD